MSLPAGTLATLCIPGLTISVARRGDTSFAVTARAEPGHDVVVATSSGVKPGDFVKVAYSHTNPVVDDDDDSNDSVQPGIAYALICAVTSTQLWGVWVVSKNDDNLSPPVARLLRTSQMALSNQVFGPFRHDEVEVLLQPPPNMCVNMLDWSSKKLSLPWSTFRDVVVSAGWVADRTAQDNDEIRARKRQRFNVFDAPGHASRFSVAYDNGSGERTAAMTLHGQYLYAPQGAIGEAPFWFEDLVAMTRRIDSLTSAARI